MIRQSMSRRVALGALIGFAAAAVSGFSGCASTPEPAPAKTDDKAKLAAAEVELDKALYEQQINMVKRFLNESDEAMKQGDNLTGAERLGQAALAYPKAYAQVAGPKDWHYRDVQQKFVEAIKRVPRINPNPTTKSVDNVKIVEVIRTVEAPPDPVDQTNARNAIARGDAAARKGDARGALREYLEALRYPRARLPSDLGAKCEKVVAKLGDSGSAPSTTPSTTPAPTVINVTQIPGSADERKKLADKLRPQAQKLTDAVGLEELRKARATYTALMATGYYTSEDVRRLLELQQKLDRATSKTIFDD